jgi:hypothetical protein
VTKKHWGASAKKKSSMIKGAPTKLGGMKKNPKDPKILSKKKNQYNDAQNQMKKTKTKRKRPNPTLGGTINHFGNTFK